MAGTSSDSSHLLCWALKVFALYFISALEYRLEKLVRVSLKRRSFLAVIELKLVVIQILRLSSRVPSKTVYLHVYLHVVYVITYIEVSLMCT